MRSPNDAEDPKLATNSLKRLCKACAPPDRVCRDALNKAAPNMRRAPATPAKDSSELRCIPELPAIPPWDASASVTAGPTIGIIGALSR